MLEVRIAPYSPEDDAEAIALERLCPQGERLRLSFRRRSFRLRSESFPEWQIWTARVGARLVGTTAAAIKPAELDGRPLRAGFAYDLRVDPACRGSGLARRLMAVAHAWAFERSELGYTYSVAENRVARHLIASFGAAPAGGYEYLVVPTGRGRHAPPARPISAAEAHERHLAVAGPFDFYTPPSFEHAATGYVRSWRTGHGGDEASCSVWDNGAILGETVEALPALLTLARLVGRAPGIRSLPIPHLPAPGERIRSWYLFDVSARSAGGIRSLVDVVSRHARDAGVDWLYWIAPDGSTWTDGVLAGAPGLASLRLRYVRMLQLRDGSTPRLRKAYVDVRDV